MNFKSPLLPIFLIIFVDVLGVTIILPLLPFYSQSLGASAFEVGALVSVYGLCQLIAGPVLGQISDRVGRKRVLLISQAGTLAGFALLAFARSLWVVYLSRVIDGLTAGNIVVAQAYIADVTPAKNRARAFGVIGASFGVGFLAGPAISGMLAKFGMQAPIFAAVALSATSMVATALLLRGGRPNVHSLAPTRKLEFGFMQLTSFMRDPNVAPYLALFAAFCVAFVSYTAGFALFVERRLWWDGRPFGLAEVGYAFSYSGFLSLVIQLGLIGPLVNRFGETNLVKAGFISMAFGYALLSEANSVALLAVAITLHSCGSSILRPTISSLISRNVEARFQGSALGASQSILSLAQIAMPLAAGGLIEHGYLMAWAWLGAVVAAAGACAAMLKNPASISIRNRRASERRESPPSAPMGPGLP